MLRDCALKYYDPSYDLNCAETIMTAANETYRLNIDADAFRAMAAFGGGVHVEDICGALTGAVAVIGILYTSGKGHTSPKVTDLTKEMVNAFHQRMGTHACADLKENYRTEEKRCGDIIAVAADVLEEIIKREGSAREQ